MTRAVTYANNQSKKLNITQRPMQPVVDTIYNMDCRIGMNNLIPDDSIDLAILDPYFGMDFESRKNNYNRTQKRVIQGYKDVEAKDYYAYVMSWATQLHRVMKPHGSAYVFSGYNNLKHVLNVFEDLGFHLENQIIWKYQFGVWTTKKFVTSHYNLLFYTKRKTNKKTFNTWARFGKDERNEAKGSLNFIDREDVWYIKREYWHGDKKTPTKLPLELCKKIIQYSSNPNDIILDPFVGSGQVPIAAKQLKRKFIGFEIEKSYFDFANKRIIEDLYHIKTKIGQKKKK